MAHVWDVYLDAGDAPALLGAFAVLERHRAVREPLPMHDVAVLLDRLQTIAEVAEEDAVYWRREACDRAEEARADGGRWAAPAVAMTMVATATDLADGAAIIAAAAYDAAAELAARIDAAAGGPPGASGDTDVIPPLDRDPRPGT